MKREGREGINEGGRQVVGVHGVREGVKEDRGAGRKEMKEGKQTHGGEHGVREGVSEGGRESTEGRNEASLLRRGTQSIIALYRSVGLLLLVGESPTSTATNTATSAATTLIREISAA